MTSASQTTWLNDAARGLAQQMVFWGQDVRHPEGNSLVRFGMSRTPSQGLTGTSCYSMRWEGGTVMLHGAVASWTPSDRKHGFIFSRDVRRMELWLGENPPVPGRARGSHGSPADRWTAALPFLRWLLAYERWVPVHCGPEWRMHCWRNLKRLPKGRPWLSPPLANRWWDLAVTSVPPRSKHLEPS